MNPVWLLRNIRTSQRYAASPRDFWRRLAWTYSGKLPKELSPRQSEIGFRYPDPVGALQLSVRANGGSDAFIHSEVFEHRYYDLGLKFTPRTILDLGANAGFTAVYFARAYPDAEIACVEPIPGNLDILNRNLALNHVRATVFAAAVDVDDGQISMELDRNDYGHKVAGAASPADHVMTCESLSIPTIMKRLGWGRIGLLKMDIEGHERVLFSRDFEWMDHVDAMCIECHEGFGEADLIVLAKRFGFASPERLPGIWLLSRPDSDG